MGRKSGGLGTTLVLALVIVALSLALGASLTRSTARGYPCRATARREAAADYRGARRRGRNTAAVEKIEASARGNGILDAAEGNAQNSIRAFVTSLGFEKVRFE